MIRGDFETCPRCGEHTERHMIGKITPEEMLVRFVAAGINGVIANAKSDTYDDRNHQSLLDLVFSLARKAVARIVDGE